MGEGQGPFGVGEANVAAACERFIAEFLKPRFLPVIRPTEFNYPVDIFGKWRGSKYSFTTRYRSGFPENVGEEFDSAFARLDHVEECIEETRFQRYVAQAHGTMVADASLRNTRRSTAPDRDGAGAAAADLKAKDGPPSTSTPCETSRAKGFSRAARAIIAAVRCRFRARVGSRAG